MSHIRYLIRRRDTGQHVGFEPDHVHTWDDKAAAERYAAKLEHSAIEEYTLRPTWLQQVRWFLAWVTG